MDPETRLGIADKRAVFQLNASVFILRDEDWFSEAEFAVPDQNVPHFTRDRPNHLVLTDERLPVDGGLNARSVVVDSITNDTRHAYGSDLVDRGEWHNGSADNGQRTTEERASIYVHRSPQIRMLLTDFAERENIEGSWV
jgi:hypothetical protein